MSGWKKFRNKTYARMLGGDISVKEARARYNLEAARRGKPLLRPAGAGVDKSAGVTVPQVWENHSNPQIREGSWDAMVMKSAAGAAPPPVSPASLWTDADIGLLYQSEHHSDPAQRAAAWQALVKRGMVPGVPAPAGDRQVPITLSPEVRGHLQLPGGWTV